MNRDPQPTSTAKAKRDALLRELRTGRRIPAYEMVHIAGLQYSRAVHELRWNVNGCIRQDCPKGLEYGLNIQNDNPDPRRPDHTVFYLAEGHWVKPIRVRKPNRAFLSAIERDDAWDDLARKREPIQPPLFSTAAAPRWVDPEEEAY